MSRDVKIQCPLCHVSMEYKLKENFKNRNGKQVIMICPKCGKNPKAALRIKLAQL